MQSLFLTAVFAGLMFMGFTAAFGAALGFVWVDIVKPQALAYSIIRDLPLSLIAALAMLSQFTIKDRKHPPQFGSLLILISALAVWITLTSWMSTVPSAWTKWDWVFKVLVFSVLIPFIFRSRIQIEAFILVFIFSAATIFFSAGIKTLLGSGGYGVLAIMGGGNTGLAEGSTLAAVCAMLIPLILHVMRNSLIFPKSWFSAALFTGIIVTAIAAIVGTAARTGLIAMGVLFVLGVIKSKHRAWLLIGGVLLAIVLMNIDLSATPWGARMSTIETYDQDSSAMGRIAVWQWTAEYSLTHIFGGGFDAFRLSNIAGVAADGTLRYYPPGSMLGLAFHSVYFEVLGEQGILGFLMYFSMIIITLLKLSKLRKKWRNHGGMAWLVSLADALTSSILVFLAGGAFIGIAYQPFIFYMIGLTVAIDQYSARVEKDMRLKLKEGK